jgi:hypothetical protein
MMRVFHQDERATIGLSIAVLDGVTYPIAAIASVDSRRVRRKIGCAPILCFLIGAPLLMSASGHAFHALSPRAALPIDRETIKIAIGFALLGGALLIGGLLMLGRRSYALFIGTSAGERAALVADDAAYIARLRAAIEQAIRLDR